MKPIAMVVTAGGNNSSVTNNFWKVIHLYVGFINHFYEKSLTFKMFYVRELLRHWTLNYTGNQNFFKI